MSFKVRKSKHISNKFNLTNYLTKLNNRFSKVNYKTFLFIIVIAFFTIIAFFNFSKFVFLGEFKKLEEERMLKDTDRIGSALNYRISKLYSSNSEYSNWYLTYNYILGNYPRLIEENFMDGTFISNKWNVLIITDVEGNIIYKKGFNLEELQETPINDELLDINSLMNFESTIDSNTGIVTLSNKPMMIVSQPIFTNKKEGSIVGAFITGTYLNSSVISELSQLTKLPVSFENFDEKFINENLKETRELFLDKIQLGVINYNNETITGKAIIYDIYGNPSFTLNTDRKMHIYIHGKESLYNFIFISIFLGLLIVIFVLFFIDKYIFRKLKYLSENINLIIKNKDFSTRVNINSNDEFSVLGKKFNKMLDSLEGLHNKLLYQANHDYITDLPNRNLFYCEVNKILSKIDENMLAAFIFIDFDEFKTVNDSFGHKAGDSLLKGITYRLKEIVSQNALISRVGGDEFIIFSYNFDDKNYIENIVKQILKSIKKPFTIGENKLFVTASIGISLYCSDGKDFETLIKNADIAMLDVKKEGKNNYKYYSSGMRSKITVDKLRNALLNNEIKVYYQPKVNGISNCIEGMEALIRWEHSECGMVSPLEFIPLAEETGLITSIGEYVLKEACHQNKVWQEMGYPCIPVSVNISGIQFIQMDFIETINKVLSQTKLDPKYLDLEITESVAMYKEDEVINKLKILRDMGISISLDDFGTGYSSLSYIDKFPISGLKIDKSFIDKININSNMAKMIIGIGENLGLSVTAEGVETVEQLNQLLDMNCTLIQGYLFSRPLPCDKFEEILQKNKLEIEH